MVAEVSNEGECTVAVIDANGDGLQAHVVHEGGRPAGKIVYESDPVSEKIAALVAEQLRGITVPHKEIPALVRNRIREIMSESSW
jgi:hypothetical protein